MLSNMLLLCLFICKINALLCYNGTFSHRHYEDDPLDFKGLLSDTRKEIARLRCAFTIPCAGKALKTMKVFIGEVNRQMEMSYLFVWLVWGCIIDGAVGLICFNCSTTHQENSRCAGDFAPPADPFNSSRYILVNCSGDDALCFVRSWVARAKYAWMVQRGCYQTSKDDVLPRTMVDPTRSMSCRHERLAEAEYKVCFCHADWCNSAHDNPLLSNVVNILIGVTYFIRNYT